MKIWEEMLERLRNGDSTENVRKSCRSASQFAKAIGIFNEEMSRKGEETRRANIEEQKHLSESKAADKRLLAEAESLQKDVNSLREENVSLSFKVQELRTDAEDLERKDYLPETIREIKKFQVKNGAKAIQVLQDHDKAVALQCKIQTLSTKEAGLICSISSLDKKKQEINKKLLIAENNLDLKNTECTVAKKRLERLNLVEREAESRLEQLISFYSRSLQENVSKGKETLELITVQVKKEVNAVMSEFVEKTRFANEALAVSMYERGKLEESKRKVEPIFVLLELSTDARLAEKVSPDLVVLLLENLKHWIDQKFPNMTVRAGYDCLANKFVSNPWVNLTSTAAYLEFTIDCIKEETAKESKNKTNADGGEK